MSAKIGSSAVVRRRARAAERNQAFARALHDLASAVADCSEPVDLRTLRVEVYRQQAMGSGLDFEIDIEVIHLTARTTKETP